MHKVNPKTPGKSNCAPILLSRELLSPSRSFCVPACNFGLQIKEKVHLVSHPFSHMYLKIIDAVCKKEGKTAINLGLINNIECDLQSQLHQTALGRWPGDGGGSGGERRAGRRAERDPGIRSVLVRRSSLKRRAETREQPESPLVRRFAVAGCGVCVFVQLLGGSKCGIFPKKRPCICH